MVEGSGVDSGVGRRGGVTSAKTPSNQGSVLLAVDPGIRGCGVAVFEATKLVHASYVRNPVREGTGAGPAASMASWIVGSTSAWKPNALALEWPRVYARMIREGKSKGDPNDLLGLAAIDAAVAALLAPAIATCYAPSDWKGQMTKEACHLRIQKRLVDREAFVAAEGASEAGALAHNMWDAVGIGLHHLGRLAPIRNFGG